MALRYVILHHTGVDHPHYDLMFEFEPDSPLMTFRSPIWPIDRPTPVERLPDHRPAYLDYEGPLTRARGQVARIERGQFQMHTQPDGTLHITPCDSVPPWRLLIKHIQAQEWLAARINS